MNRNRKTALITGASSGIGKALVENFAKDGYDVILAARSFSKLENRAIELQSRYGIAATAIAADLESEEGASKLHAEIEARGFTLSALANNAGYGLFGEFKDSSLPEELAMMRVNMTAVVILTKLFLPDLLSTQGKIINTASTAAFQPGPYMAIYYATKAFVLSFSEAIAAELEGTGVTVTAFCPGATASGFQDKANMQRSALVKGKKLPTADEVAALGYRAMQRGQRVYIPGTMNWLMAQSTRFVPRNVATRIVKAMSKPI
ncbi:SDR family NAD(P)-dependent oxidoreductase [Altericista sp. CCNU0014]|uniref:SDR family NAD(P)-dependent oxidoreductase n=1 Tax=Altericista sp. CCNU0014 TaxID=3082949 RepID=UPI00384F298A